MQDYCAAMLGMMQKFCLHSCMFFVPGKRFSLALPMLPVWKRYRLGYVFIVKKVHIVIDYNF